MSISLVMDQFPLWLGFLDLHRFVPSNHAQALPVRPGMNVLGPAYLTA